MFLAEGQNDKPVSAQAADCLRVEHAAKAGRWDAFVRRHLHGTLYHLYGWRGVVEKTYGHKGYYLVACKESTNRPFQNGGVAGVLPLFHLSNVFFGNSLVSMPFFDMGGVLGDNSGAEKTLVDEATRLGKKLNVDTIELRYRSAASCPEGSFTGTNKVRMLLDLPGSAPALMNGFKSKLRSQIHKASKEGLQVEIGGAEFLDDFYEVFLVNMRDLGSPVHSKRLMANVLEAFPGAARVVLVRHAGQAVAGSIVVGFGDVLENPWASALRRFSHLSPNMLLYWTMLVYACEKGFKQFDFGRSTPGEGTYKFKAQWGARPEPLHWTTIPLKGQKCGDSLAEDRKFQLASAVWKKLPVPMTKLIGPMIRKHISL